MNRNMKKLIEDYEDLSRRNKLSRSDDIWCSEIDALKKLSIDPKSGKVDEYLFVINAYKVGFMLGSRAEKRNAKKEKAINA